MLLQFQKFPRPKRTKHIKTRVYVNSFVNYLRKIVPQIVPKNAPRENKAFQFPYIPE